MKAKSTERSTRSDDPILSDKLLDLAEQFRDNTAAAEEGAETAAQRMIENGQLLIEAKGLCLHGLWRSFLEAAGVNERKAQRLMQIAREELKSDTVSDLGFRGSLELIAERRREKKEAALADERPDLSTVIELTNAANKLAEQQRELLATGQPLNFGSMVLRQEPSPDMRGPIRRMVEPASPPDAPDARMVCAHTIAFAEFIQSAEIDPCELWHDLSEIETHKRSNTLLMMRNWIDAAEKAKP